MSDRSARALGLLRERYPAIRVGGFWAEMKREFDVTKEECEIGNIVPDAFFIKHHRAAVFEIDATHPTPFKKWEEYDCVADVIGTGVLYVYSVDSLGREINVCLDDVCPEFVRGGDEKEKLRELMIHSIECPDAVCAADVYAGWLVNVENVS